MLIPGACRDGRDGGVGRPEGQEKETPFVEEKWLLRLMILG
jgi:hypothetical protein